MELIIMYTNELYFPQFINVLNNYNIEDLFSEYLPVGHICLFKDTYKRPIWKPICHYQLANVCAKIKIPTLKHNQQGVKLH